jgi:hypothetical protein
MTVFSPDGRATNRSAHLAANGLAMGATCAHPAHNRIAAMQAERIALIGISIVSSWFFGTALRFSFVFCKDCLEELLV